MARLLIKNKSRTFPKGIVPAGRITGTRSFLPVARLQGIRGKVRDKTGQFLIELLVGISVGVILIGAAATLIAVVLGSSRQNKFFQAASYLRQDLLDKITVFAERQWYCSPTCITNLGKFGIYNLQKGETRKYYLDTSTPQFTWVAGEESSVDLILDNVQYKRYFYLENVCRDPTTEAIIGTAIDTCSSGSEDPSTQFVTVVVSWQQAAQNQEIKLAKYLARRPNQVLVQTDWSGGANPGAPSVTEPDNKFESSSDNIDFLSTPGVIKLKP